MRLSQIVGAQVVRLLEPNRLTEGRESYYLYDLVKGIEARYRFLQAPKLVDEYDCTKGIRFLNGVFNKHVGVDRFELFANGIICEGKFATEELEGFVEDVFGWAEKEFGIPPSKGPQAYLSHLEIHSETDIAEKFAAFSTFGQNLTDLLRSYGQATAEFKVSMIGLHSDQTETPFPKATAFVFDRRQGKPYSEQLYFSSAPLKTADHLRVLDKLEGLLAC